VRVVPSGARRELHGVRPTIGRLMLTVGGCAVAFALLRYLLEVPGLSFVLALTLVLLAFPLFLIVGTRGLASVIGAVFFSPPAAPRRMALRDTRYTPPRH
jgi:hypothetical protein